MGLFDKIKEPVFVKENSSMEEQLAALNAMLETAPPEIVKKIEQDIKLINAGNYGENNIVFELKNSHMPMLVLRDLYLEHAGLTAQIDFLIITRKRVYVVECKNLYGNIEINNQGDFIRTGSYGKKEGIYSPITQNQRHLELIKQIRLAERGNILTKALFEKGFYDTYRSIVVLANPKTVLNAKYAKKEVKDKVIRADQLVAYIQRSNAEPDAASISERDMESLAQFFLSKHRTNATDYTTKYQGLIEDMPAPVECESVSEPEPAPIAEETPAETTVLCPRCGAPMVRRKAGKGQNAGKEFYGCSKFPKCRGIVNIKS